MNKMPEPSPRLLTELYKLLRDTNNPLVVEHLVGGLLAFEFPEWFRNYEIWIEQNRPRLTSDN